MTTAPIPALLDRLELFHGVQEPSWPCDPYDFLVWWHCGYPASDENCARGWQSLTETVGTNRERLLQAPHKKLSAALHSGGMVPELRAQRLKEIAMRVQNEFGGDLRAGLVGPLAQIRKSLKKFPGVADPGVDRILLFAGLVPVAAVPSNCPHVLVRFERGQESENYTVNYREAKQSIETEVPPAFDALTRAYLLLKRHGQELCKRSKPKCDKCPVNDECAYNSGHHRGVPVSS